MAHADYNCCTVCDCKMEYSHDATTKENICTYCLKALRANGVNALDVDELTEWIKSETPENVKSLMDKVGYSKCFYGNDFDELVKSKIDPTVNI